MSKKHKKILALVFGALIISLVGWYLSSVNIPLLEPAGQVGEKERQLMITALLLAVIVVVPVFAMTIFIALKYREGNKKPRHYNPDWDHSRLFEGLWWGIPAAIIAVLSVITWQSSHALDPYKVLAATNKPLTVQVVAMDWKWLFIYPAQNIASVNLLEMPVNTPVNFEITSDTVMNSFWIPQLGGQIYAMPGMETQLHLVANKLGSFNGWSANISGTGFASMTFTAKSVQSNKFNNWILNAKKSDKVLSQTAYNNLAKPTNGYPVTYYKSVGSGLFFNLINKYMMPGNEPSGMSGQPTGGASGNAATMTMPMNGSYMQ